MIEQQDHGAGLNWPQSVICFGGEDWWYHNRGHCDMQMMRQFGRHGRILYVNSIVMRKPNIGEGAMFVKRLLRKTRSIFRGYVKVSDDWAVYSPVTAPVHHLPGARMLNDRFLRLQVRVAARRLGCRRPLIWVNCPAACDTAIALRRSGLVYQRTDRYEDHPGVDVERITYYDRRLRSNADVTFYSNRQLYEEERANCRNAIYVPHGVDYDRFANAEKDSTVPEAVKMLRRPIVGFFGAIDEHKFNRELAVRIAELLPELTFVFVGGATADCSALERMPNVHLLGQQPYDQIPHFGKCFDVCIMPFNQNRWIEAFNPIKLKEYLALGKPIVTTPFGELDAFEGMVRIAEGPEAFAAAIREALSDNAAEAVEARRRHVEPHSWYAKAAEVLAALQKGESNATPAGAPLTAD